MKKVVAEDAKVFTSGTAPLLLPVEYVNKKNPERLEKLMMMFKTGDDMR
jgi:hypothetical protein